MTEQFSHFASICRFRHVWIVATLLFVAGCGSTVDTRSLRPESALAATISSQNERGSGLAPTNELDFSAAVATAGQNSEKLNWLALSALKSARDLQSKDPDAAIGWRVAALELALKAANPSELPGRFDLANQALLQILSEVEIGKSQRIATPLGVRTLEVAAKFDSSNSRPPFQELVPSELVEIYGMDYRVTAQGFGVPVVGVFRDPMIPFYEKRGTFSPATAVPSLSSDGKTLRVDLVNPNQVSQVPGPGGLAPLAADITTPIAMFYDGLNDLALGLQGLFRVGNQIGLAGLYMIEPYDPDRIPVLMVHGLGSSPLIWRNMINELQINPRIRKNFQFWVAYYPSGLPINTSAQFLRDNLTEIRKTFDPDGNDRASGDLITFGHSMGGVITRMNAVEIGDRLWSRFSRKPFDELDLDPDDRAELQDKFFWEPIPNLSESIYFSAPHHGAVLADGSLANFGMRLIRFPSDFFRFQKRILSTLGGFLVLDFDVSKLFNSIGSLSPSNPVFPALDGAPYKSDFVYHSVVGDRGLGDTPDSSDGIVGYWSSHLPDAQSELIVPTGHESFKHPEAVRFTAEILEAHLE